MTNWRPRSVAVRRTSTVAWMAGGSKPTAFTVDAAGDLADLAVEEDPVVELASPAMQIRRADEPADLGERRLEGDPVHRDPAAPGAGTLDDLHAAILGGGPEVGSQGDGDGPQVERLALDRCHRDRTPIADRRPDPGPVALARRGVLAQLVSGRDVGEPSEIPVDPKAGQVDRADRVEVGGAVQLEVQSRRGAACQGHVAERRLARTARRPESRRGNRPVAKGDLVGDRGGPERSPGQTRGQDGDHDAGEQPLATKRRLAVEAAGDAEAGEQAGGREGDEPRVGGLDRGEERLGSERGQLVDHPHDRRDEAEDSEDPEPQDRSRTRGRREPPAARRRRSPRWRSGRGWSARRSGRTGRPAGRSAGSARPDSAQHADQRTAQEPELETANPHAMSLSVGPAHLARGGRAPRKYQRAWDGRVIATAHGALEHAPTAPNRTEPAAANGPRTGCHMAVMAQRGSRDRGRSSPRASPAALAAAPFVGGPGIRTTCPGRRPGADGAGEPGEAPPMIGLAPDDATTRAVLYDRRRARWPARQQL